MDSGGLDGSSTTGSDHLAGAPGAARAADRPAAPGASRASAARRQRRCCPSELLAADPRAGERAGATTLHDAARGVHDAALPLQRPGRRRRRARRSPIATASSSSGVIGFFVNTLALRSRPRAASRRSRELLRRVRETALGGFSNQDIPFEKLVEELNPERDRSHAPVAQVMFVLQSAAERPARRSPGCERARRRTSERGTAKFDLALFADRDARRACASRSSTAPTCSTRRRSSACSSTIRTLLEGDRRRPERVRSSELRAAEPRRARADPATSWNDTARSAAPSAACTSCSPSRPARTPDAVAVSFGAQELDLRRARRARQPAGPPPRGARRRP